jgi:hypothetical protein
VTKRCLRARAYSKATTKRGFSRNPNSTEVDPFFVASFDAVDSRVIGFARFDAAFAEDKEMERYFQAFNSLSLPGY